jgi:hypothetical protein
MLVVAGLRRTVCGGTTMASLEWERPSDRPAAAAADHPRQAAGDVNRTDAPYETTVERLFALLEENQVAITALAQAWRHTNRTLELTQAQLAHTQELLDVERGNR